jgi:hypothetical protein
MVLLLLKYETQRWREKFLGNKSLYINEEVAYGEVISYNKIIEVKNVDKVLYKVKCK